MLSQITRLLVSWSMLHFVSAIEFKRQQFAISAQSFHRDDVPLSYKFTATHDYTTTPKHDDENHEPHLHEPPHLQYAPLTALYAKYYGSKGPKGQNSEQNLRKDHLEPRLQYRFGSRQPTPEGHVHTNAQTMQAHGDYYVPGHNIQVMQSVTHIPALNAVYKGYKDGTDNHNQYQRQHFLYSNKQRQLKKLLEMAKTDALKTPPVIPESTTPKIIVSVNKYAEDNIYDNIPEKQQILLYNLAPYAKKHALFLNVARSYNFLPNTLTGDSLLRASRHGGAATLSHVETPETQAHQQNTYSVLHSKKIKDKRCYGCEIGYEMYNPSRIS